MTETEEALRARSLKFLEDEKLSYQAVALPGGVSTPGSDRSYLNEAIFGEDFRTPAYAPFWFGEIRPEALRFAQWSLDPDR